MADSISLKNRLIGSAGANLYGQLVTVAMQLVQVPVLIASLGVDRYGEWLVLYAIPGYLALSDLGVGAVAANRICMLSASGKYDEAKAVLRTTWVFLSLVCVALTLFIAAGALILDWSRILSLHSIERGEAGFSIAALGLMVVFSLPGSLIEGLYRAGHRNARGVAISSSWRLAQLGVIVAMASSTKSLGFLAVALFVIQFLSFIFQLLDVRRFVPDIGVFGSTADWDDLVSMWKPSLAFMLFPIANALYFQGATLVVNALYGAGAVVLFNTTRTLTRALTQGVTVIKHSIWPEFSYLFGLGEMKKIRFLYYAGLELALIFTLIGSGALMVVAKPLLLWWTHGKVPCDYNLLAVLSVATIANGIWFTASAFLQATNNHTFYAIVYCGASISSMLFAVAAGRFIGILAVPLAMVFVEVVTGVVVLTSAAKILGDSALFSIGELISFRHLFCRIKRAASGLGIY